MSDYLTLWFLLNRVKRNLTSQLTGCGVISKGEFNLQVQLLNSFSLHRSEMFIATCFV